MNNKLNSGYVDDKGNSLKNSAYDLSRCIMTNVDGDKRDIRNMVGDMSITENIFSPTLVLQLGIRDESNFIEEFNITGSETLDIEIITKAGDIERVLTFLFYVQVYDDYARSANDNQVQAYTLVAVSEHAYIAPLKTISRVVEGTNTSLIQSIFEDDLNIEGFIVEGTCGTQVKKNINISNPIIAAEQLLSSAADINRTPYFLYQDISASMNLRSLSAINDRDQNPVYKTFRNTKTIKDTSGTGIEYYERSTQMTKVISNIGLSPSSQAKSGAFASENRYIDISSKTYRTKIFDASLELDAQYTTSKGLNHFDQKLKTRGVNEEENPLTRIPQANTNYQYVNPDSYSNAMSTSELDEQQSHISRAYIAGYDTCAHSFTVMGDTFLNPGRTIELLFPKATDPIIYKKYTGKSDTDQYDKTLSGDYLIFSAVHRFVAGVHTTELIAKTDSLKPYE